MNADVTRFGRHSHNDYYLDSSQLAHFISRWHSEIHRVEQDGEIKYIIRDNSLNGTYVNDVRVCCFTHLECFLFLIQIDFNVHCWSVKFCLFSDSLAAKYKVVKGPFTLSISVNAAMSIAISLQLNCSDFLRNQASHYKNGLQPRLIRYDAGVGADAPNQSLTLSVNRA